MPKDICALVFSSLVNAGVPVTLARLTTVMVIPLNPYMASVSTGLIVFTEPDVDQVYFLSRSVQVRCLSPCTINL